MGFAFIASCFYVQNFDVWWHLKTGELTVRNCAVAKEDPYSFAAAGSRWVNSGWLTQVGMYGLFECCGFPGLVVAKALLVAGCVLLLFIACRERGGSAVACAAVIVCAVAAARFRLRVRPAVLSGPMCAVFLWLLDKHERRGTRWVWLLPALMALWVNLHPGFPVGFVLISPYFLAALWRGRHVSAFLKPTRVRTLTFVGVLCVAAALANPFGYHPLIYPLRLTSAHAFMRDIGEWAAPAFNRFYAPFWGYFAAGLACVALTWRSLKLSDALVLAVFGSMAVSAMRHVFYFAIVAAPIFSKHLTLVGEAACAHWPQLGKQGARKLAALAIAGAMLLLSVRYVCDERDFPFGLGLRMDFVPAAAVDFIEERHLSNNVCNAYQWGGYLAWRCFPRRQIYIDGRCMVYGEKLYLEWKRAITAQEGWEDTFKRRGVNTLLLAHDVPLPILNSPDWRPVHWDDLSVVFVRRTPDTAHLIERFGCDLTLPQNFERNWSDEARRPELAQALERKVERQPNCVTALVCLARCRGLLGEVESAVNLMAEARRMAPGDTTVLNQFAYWLAEAKRTREAMAAYAQLLRLSPRHAVGHYGMAGCLQALGELGRAERHYRKAVRFMPRFAAARQRLIEVLREQGKMADAEDEAARLERLQGQP